MKIIPVYLAVITIAVAACTQNTNLPAEPESQVSGSTASEQAPSAFAVPPPSAPAGSSRVISPTGEGAPTPLRMAAGESVEGSYSPRKDGALVAFGVYIGNSRQTSDGGLSLQLCQSEDCQEAKLPLEHSRDNDFLIFTLDRPITVTADVSLDYKLTRSGDATKPVAIWSYVPVEGDSTLHDTDGQDTLRVARVAAYFQGEPK